MIFVATVLAVPLVARAEGSEAAERTAEAQAACLSGDFAKGVSILAELYVSTKNATYIFNQGRCFEQNGKYEEAVLRFREYQRKNANAGVAADPVAEAHIAECQALLEKQQKAAALAAPSPTTESVPTAPTAVAAEVAPPPAQPPVAALPVASPVPADPTANRVTFGDPRPRVISQATSPTARTTCI